MKIGSRAASRSDTSMLDAVSPPTCTCTSEPLTAAGMTSSRRVATRSVVATDCGELFGITRMTAASPDGLRVGPTTAATSGVRCRRVGELVERGGVGALGELGRQHERAVEPGAEALGHEVVGLA